MKVSPVPAVLAGFCLVAFVMALFLTYPPTEQDMLSAVTKERGSDPVAYFDRLGCSQLTATKYSCYFQTGTDEASSFQNSAVFSKEDGEWKVLG